MSDKVNAILARANTDFVMFVTTVCPYCHKAKRMLDSRKLSWADHNVQKDRGLQMEVVGMTGHRTVPAIFDVRGTEPVFVGGSDDLESYL